MDIYLAPGRPGIWHIERTRTEAKWVDHNGHINIVYYFVKARMAIEALWERELQETGGAATTPSAPVSAFAHAPSRFFTQSMRGLFQREVHKDEAIDVTVEPLERDERSVRTAVRIERPDAGGQTAFVADWRGMGMDANWQARALTAAERVRFDSKLQEGGPGFPPTPNPPITLLPEDALGMRRESHLTIAPDWIGRQGCLMFDRVPGLFMSVGMIGPLILGGFDEFLSRGFSLFAIDYRHTANQPLFAGDKVAIRSHVHAIGKKTVNVKHRVWKLGADGKPGFGEPAFENDETMACVDMETRRAMPLHPWLAERISKAYGIEIPQ